MTRRWLSLYVLHIRLAERAKLTRPHEKDDGVSPLEIKFRKLSYDDDDISMMELELDRAVCTFTRLWAFTPNAYLMFY
jgi:hypothetical protein